METPARLNAGLIGSQHSFIDEFYFDHLPAISQSHIDQNLFAGVLRCRGK
jgi:hypothetical protein